jgi:3',5'-cyclic AMP phosphodiesterase CpdA
MTSGGFVRGWSVHALRAARSLLGGAAETVPSPREPYVQGVTASSAIICWTGKGSGVGVVEYGETPDLGRKETDTRAGRRHAVALTDLVAGSTYHYLVEGVGGSSAAGSFRTAPVGEDSRFSLAVVGDSGSGGRGQLAVAALLGRLGPDLILHTGDVVYPAGEERHYDKRFFAPYCHLTKSVPVFPVLGNHDVRKDNGAAFLENFHPPRDNPRSTMRYYSFDWGGAHFVGLDSELYYDDKGDSPERQKAFLEEDLAATRKRWKIAFLHRSPYGSSRHGGDGRVRENLEPVFAGHKVNVVLAGHDHVYERTVPIRGVTYVVSGGGGRRLYRVGKGKSTAFSKSAHHAVLIHLGGGRLSLEAIEPGGTVFDRSDLEKP